MKFLCTLPERLYKYLIANGYRKHRQCYIYLRSPYHVCSHVDKFNLENIQKMDIGTWASTNFRPKYLFLPLILTPIVVGDRGLIFFDFQQISLQLAIPQVAEKSSRSTKFQFHRWRRQCWLELNYLVAHTSHAIEVPQVCEAHTDIARILRTTRFCQLYNDFLCVSVVYCCSWTGNLLVKRRLLWSFRGPRQTDHRFSLYETPNNSLLSCN